MAELKPCPFCGGKAEIHVRGNIVRVECTVCQASMGTATECYDTSKKCWYTFFVDRKDASKAWNRRAK